MKRMFAGLVSGLLAFLSLSSFAQTLSLNDGSIVQNSTNRMGLNIGAIDYWDNGQILKNLIGSTNPGFEPLQNRQIWALTAAGTTTTFTIPDQYDGVPPNYWAGGTFTVVESQSGGAELGCTGAIASNSGPNYPLSGQSTYTAPVITVSSPCNAAFSVGDTVVMSKSTFPTPESWWESGSLGGMAGTVTGGAQLLSDTTDLCATCGTQSLNMNATTAGSTATATWYFDACSSDDAFVLMNGTYQLSFWAKAASGAPVLTASAGRNSQGGFSCGSYSPKLTSSWAQYTWNCTASESAAATSPGIAQVAITATGGSVYLDNVSFEKTGTNPSNTSVLRDEVIETLQNYYGPSIGSNPGMFRYWVNQNAETMSNWTQPDYAHAPAGGGVGYFVGPGGAGVVSLSLEDYLVICQLLNAEPYLEVPVTFTAADAANLIEFLASPSGTTYGARRAALGQADPWTGVFSQIHLSFCNECWNGGSFEGQSLPSRSSAPNSEYYYDYSLRARDIFAAMRADSYYSPSSFDLVMNAQTATNYSMDTAIQRARPDSIEIEGYTYGSVSSFATDAALWQPAMVEPYEKVTNPADVYNFYQSVHDYQSQKTCGASGASACNVNIYEWGQGTIAGSIDQTHMDYINAGAGEGVVMALQPLLNLQYYGIRPQSFFSLTEYRNGAANGLINKLWGNVVDMGGATNNVRPEFLGVQLVNQSIIGPMYSCPIAGNLTYNFAGSPNGISPLPALNNVPYLYAFCFENGSARSLVLINTDLSSSHVIGFSGTNPPAGTVTERQYAPAALDDMNETPTGTATNLTPATVAIETSTLSSPGSITLPPFSVTALDYTAAGLTTAAAPSFSPAAGSYSTAQTVTISDATSGATIYYTTNGTTPTTSSTVYSGPITVSATETIEAIAVATGYSNSPVTTAAYTIAAAVSAPVFSPAAGSYSTAQTVTISDATSGATIYYTTNGTAPTTSSTVYSGPITVSATETIEAIAVASGCSNSPVSTAAYTIAAAVSAPVFSPAPGTYTSPQSVTISDATSGAIIYYTTNGTTPTTSSTEYMGAIWQTSTQTLKAIAVATGYANSPVTTATYTIAPVLPAPTFSPTGGGPSWALFTSPPSVTISDSQAGTTFYYTTNGTTPTTSSTLYTGPITVNVTETIEAIAVEAGYTNSPMSSMLYSIAPLLPAPTFSLAPGTYATSQTVTISDATAGTTIYYTTNGTTPTTSSAVYSGAITVSATETLQAIAVASGYCNSPAASAAYTIAAVLPTPTFSPAPGTYTASQSVTISDATAGTTIYYTTNGTTPTTSSTKYTGAITVSATETLEAIAIESGYANSAVASAAYTIAPVLPTPTFSPAPGTYTTSQSVTISDATAGTTIYYTTNGSTPTTSSSVYSVAITVSATETLEAIAVESGYTNSAVATAAYTIAPVLPTPTFSPAPGTYTTSQSVTISDAAAGTTIYYTTNGSTPSTSSTKYSGAITVSATETLEAIAIESGYANSAVASAAYTIASVLPTPTFSPAAGTYTTSQSVTISDATAGTTIYYTTNGSTPTTSSSVYSGAITVSATETLEAIAVETGYTNSAVASAAYTIAPVLPTPTFSPAPGTYKTSQSVTISDATAGTTIYYTTNGTTPTTSSTKYTGAITVSATETLEAIAIESGYTNSAVASAAYTIAPVLPTPTFSLAPGTYTTSQSVTISDATAGTTIYYTTNGSTPTTSSTVYTGAITISATETLEAIAVETGYTNSAVGSAAYTIAPVLPTPTFSLAPGTYTTSQSVTISDATSGTTIYYTTNGTTPTTSSIVYAGAITVSATETLEAIAIETGYTNSAVGSAAYTIAPALPTPTFSPVPGTYTTSQSVTISDATAGTTIYYTTNGSTPTTSSTAYSGPITVSATETLQAIAVETGYTNSAVATAAYTIAPVLPTPTFSLAPGTYTTSQSVTISDATAGTTIYYTTNGSTPTTSSAVYSGPITVSATETLEAIAIETGYTNSAVASAAYTIAPVLPTPTFSLAPGTYTTSQSVTISDATAGTTIYYATNGSTPTTSSSVYSGAITVSATETLEAIAVETGYTSSPVATAAYTISTPGFTYINYPSGGFSAVNLSLNYGASVTGGLLQLTDGGANEERSAWFATEVPVQSFITNFTFQLLNPSADGMTFAIQGDNIWALGDPGGGLAYQGIANSVAVKFDLYNNAGEGSDSTGLYTDGAAPTVPSVDLSSTGINLHSGDIMDAQMVYDGTNLTMTLTDTVTNATVTEVFPVNIPSAVGGSTAYVGFTGSTGSSAATQNVLSWTYVSPAGSAAAAPAFSPAAGTYATPQSVTISDATPGTTIYYTTNGTTPTTSSSVYSGPITVSATETLEALAVEAGYTNSAVATAAYSIAPAISAQPTCQTVLVGNTATFTVTAAGVPTLTYVWQYLSGSTWKPFGAGTGYNTATLTTFATTAAYNGLQLRVVVTDGNGVTATSNTATLTVAPAITAQPASQTVTVGSTATFTVTAVGVPTLTYVWQYLSGSTWKPFGAGTGYSTATLTTFATTAAYNGLQLRVVVTDGDGLTATSNTATLTVAPAITAQPACQTVTVGSTATFTVTAAGVPTLTYVWQYLSGSTWKPFGAGTGYNTATLTTFATTAAYNGLQLRVVVTDGDGLTATSNAATLTVAPAITAQPASQTVSVGSTATFSVTAAGVPTLTYVWQYLSGSTWKPFGAGTGYNTPTLTTFATTAAYNALQLRVVVTDGDGLTATSNTATLTVQ